MSYTKEQQVAQAQAKSVSRKNIIRFDALDCRMFGAFDSINFGPWPAISGAGLDLGSKLEGTKLSEWIPSKKENGKNIGQRGGTIPPGWWIALPEILAKKQTSSFLGLGTAPTNISIKLVPYKLDDPNPSVIGAINRDGFYIHGPGGAGSDGCILLAKDQRIWLATMIASKGGAWLNSFFNRQRILEMIEAQQSPIV